MPACSALRFLLPQRRRIEKVEGRLFEGEEQVLHLIERIVSPLGLRVDESSPYVDARLPDGSRVNAVIPPLSLCGPAVTIRKFALRPFSPEDLVRMGGLTEPMMEFLAASVREKANIVVSGGTGTGKTTLLDALVSDFADVLVPLVDRVTAEVIKRGPGRPGGPGDLRPGRADRAMREDPEARERIRLYAQRVIGEAFTQTARAIEATEGLRALLGGDDGGKRLVLSMLDRHRQRLDRLGIDPIEE